MVTKEQENNWVIHKHVFDFDDFGVDGYWQGLFPFGARFLTAQVQRDKVCLWYRWDMIASTDEAEMRAFILIGTGWEVDKDKFVLIQYLGTVQFGSGSLVFHLFEVKVKNIDP